MNLSQKKIDVPQEGYLNKNFINIFEERQQVLILRYVRNIVEGIGESK